MKKFLFLLTLLFGALLFVPGEVQGSEAAPDSQARAEATMKEKGTADMQHQLEILSGDLEGCHCLSLRRNIRNADHTSDIRLQKMEKRTIRHLRLKETDLLRKVSEEVTICQTLHFSALLCRMRYHVYALRKIII